MTSITLNIPDHIYQEASRQAEATARSVEEVLLDRIEMAFPELPEDEQAELNALNYLSDDALRTIAREQMPMDRQNRMQILMDQNNFGTISDKGYQELSNMVEQGQKLMLRKAAAAAILTERGYTITQADMAARKYRDCGSSRTG